MSDLNLRALYICEHWLKPEEVVSEIIEYLVTDKLLQLM